MIPATGTLGLNPVWADLSPATSQLVVLNQGDGVHPGSLSIINIPLCSTASPATNPNCNSANPVDAVGFGTVLATVPVGINPVMVSVLQDGTKAYVANQGNAAAGRASSWAGLLNHGVSREGSARAGDGPPAHRALGLWSRQVSGGL